MFSNEACLRESSLFDKTAPHYNCIAHIHVIFRLCDEVFPVGMQYAV